MWKTMAVRLKSLTEILHLFQLKQQQGTEKRREPGPPNEIVACTSCAGSSSPCTHTANNGCATEVNYSYLISIVKPNGFHTILKARISQNTLQNI